jgi:hypothetical protein
MAVRPWILAGARVSSEAMPSATADPEGPIPVGWAFAATLLVVSMPCRSFLDHLWITVQVSETKVVTSQNHQVGSRSVPVWLVLTVFLVVDDT